jgi:hydroxymethylbilane synthase
LDRPIIIGTRGSPLALAQAQSVADLLMRGSKFQVHIKTFKTEGDEFSRKSGTSTPPSNTGKDSFTKTIDVALSRGEIDAAVHSLKDMPSENIKSSTIEVAAFPRRESPYDVLITKKGGDTLATLPRGARIGTSSIRRAVQLKHFRPDFEIVEIHGNVQTRLRKLESSDLDAIVLAKAGLKRLGLSPRTARLLPKRVMLPAVGQGCLAVVVRRKDSRTKLIVTKIDDQNTRAAVGAERAFSSEFGGGCNTPVAALATISRKMPSQLVLEGLVQQGGPRQAKLLARSSIAGRPKDAEKLGRELALRLKKIVR